MEPSRANAYRMRPESVVYSVFAIGFIAFGLFGAVDSVFGDHLFFGLLRLCVAWSIAAFLGLRMARLGVFVEKDGIRVRNPLKTERIPWNEIRGFLLRRSVLGEFGIAELHNGGSIRLWGIQPQSRVAAPRDRRAELAIGTLNRELQVARGYASFGSEPRQRTAQLAPGAPSPERT